jgi:uncharacterized coiled-coil protein SlyX
MDNLNAPPTQGLHVTLEELYQVIGEKEMVRFKLQDEVKRLNGLVERLQQELAKAEGKRGRSINQADGADS